MPVHSGAWLLLFLLSPAGEEDGSAPGLQVEDRAAPDLVEGETCVLVGSLEVQEDEAAPARRIEAGAEVRIVRPQPERTDVLVDERLVSADTAALSEACRAPSAESAPRSLPPDEALALAEERFEALKFAESLAPLRDVLADPRTDVDQRARAYVLQGSALAIMGYTIEAESTFRSLLRLEPGFQLAESTSPKVASVFDRVAREMEALRRQEAQKRRAELLEELQVTLTPPAGKRGGEPLLLEVDIRDPRGVVEEARAFYRRAGEPSFASIALDPTGTGRWAAELPAAFTVNEAGLALELYVSTFDEQGEALVGVGSPEAPIRAEVEPGALPSTPFYKTFWFWTVVGASSAAVAAVVTATAVGVGVAAAMPPVYEYLLPVDGPAWGPP